MDAPFPTSERISKAVKCKKISHRSRNTSTIDYCGEIVDVNCMTASGICLELDDYWELQSAPRAAVYTVGNR